MKMKLKLIIIATSVLVITIIILLSQCFEYYESPLQAFRGKWESSISNRVSTADQLDIYDSWTDEYILSVTNINEISELISAIKINEAKSDFICFCCGTYRLVFKQGTSELATVCFHDEDFPEARLDWRSGEWPKHGVLTSESSSEIYSWFENHNIKTANQGMDPTLTNAF